MDDDIQENREVIEKKTLPLKNFLTSVVVFILIIIVFFIITLSLNLDLLFLTMIACFFIVVYSIVLFFLLEPRVIREINTTSIRTVDRPQEVIVEKPVQIIHEIEKRIYITPDPEPIQQIEKRTASIPKYDYIGSSQTHTYHKRACRFSKLIKPKYKILNNNSSYFVRNKYKPCEICILKTKKV